MTKLIALFSYYNENALDLVSSINDLARIGVTDIVAVEGCYENFPAERFPHSRIPEASTLLSRCSFHGIGLTMALPNGPWIGDEVAKRQRMLQLAHVVAGGEDAWICVWDADYRLFLSDLELSRAFTAPLDAMSYDILFTDDPSEVPSSWYRMKMFMRLEPGMRMGTNHYTYLYQDGGRFHILPSDESVPIYPIRVQHLKYRRPQSRLDAQAAFYAIRDSRGLEPT